jgi:hypothetical protein
MKAWRHKGLEMPVRNIVSELLKLLDLNFWATVIKFFSLYLKGKIIFVAQ